MISLSEYSAGVRATPANSPRAVNAACADTESIRPFDTSGAIDAVNSGFNSCDAEIDEIISVILSHLHELEETLGTQFISLNGSDLGIVNVDKYNEYLTKLKNELEDAREECEQLCNDIESQHSSINTTLDALQSGYEAYENACNCYDAASDSYNIAATNYNLTSSETYLNEMNQYSREMSQWQEVKNRFEPLVTVDQISGSWVIE